MATSTQVLQHFDDVTDPRRGEPVYPLINIVFIAICAVIAERMISWPSRNGPTPKTSGWPSFSICPGHSVARSVQRDPGGDQAGRVREVPVELDHRAARNHRRPDRGHRRQDVAAQLRRGQQQVGDSHGQRVGHGQPYQSWASGGRRRRATRSRRFRNCWKCSRFPGLW